MSDFKPDEQYDPSRPNDLGEYQYYRKKLREEKRARLAEEKKRREEEGSGQSSYYSDSEDEAPRRDGTSYRLYEGNWLMMGSTQTVGTSYLNLRDTTESSSPTTASSKTTFPSSSAAFDKW